MKTRQNNTIRTNQPGSRVIIVGGGIAGLSAARVLAKYFEQVTVLDRDWLPEKPAFRSGIPQAHHAHTLLPYGQKVLDQLFPGFIDQLLAEGAETIETVYETNDGERGMWRIPGPGVARPSVSCSRPMLESLLYRRINELPRVKILPGYEVTELLVNEDCQRVTGVAVRSRKSPGDPARTILADVVVDASGRNSKAPEWLARLGYLPPEEWRIDAHAGYASRIYRQPEGYRHGWKKLYIGPLPPDRLRGGVIVPLEGGRWHVTLIGLAGDYPPTDEAGFIDFARNLPDPALYEAIRAAEPLSKITGFRRTENRVRRFDTLPRYLEGLLVIGDAVFTMNPIYSLGMTAAAISSQVLDQVFQLSSTRRTELAAEFQKKLASKVTALWRQAVQSDWLWPETDISDNTEALYPIGV